MATTSIQWTDHSINPIRARNVKTGAIGHYCEKVSHGCTNCYASNLQKRFNMPAFVGGKKRETLPVRATGCVQVSDDIEVFLDESKLQEVLRRKKPTKYFWCDMTDMFGSWVPDEWIDRCFAVMALTPQHTHQVLTKRAERMREYFTCWEALRLPQDRAHRTATASGAMGFSLAMAADVWAAFHPDKLPLPNVWLGVSVENQEQADARIPLLLQTPAAVRFLSCEPLLGPIRLPMFTDTGDDMPEDERSAWGLPKTYIQSYGAPVSATIDWVIVGSESGPKRRPMDAAWARSIRDQCKAAGVAFFMKQMEVAGRVTGDIADFPEDLRVREYPAAAVVLD